MKNNKKQLKILNAKNAVYVENITGVKGEEEIIFPSGTEFFINDINEHVLQKFFFGEEKYQQTEIQITIPLFNKN